MIFYKVIYKNNYYHILYYYIINVYMNINNGVTYSKRSNFKRHTNILILHEVIQRTK